jgi:hypothetical protein
MIRAAALFLVIGAIGIFGVRACATVVLPSTPRGALKDLGVAGRTIIDATHRLERHLCPRAFNAGGRQLTRRQARACIAKVWNGYIGALKSGGYAPERIAVGGP